MNRHTLTTDLQRLGWQKVGSLTATWFRSIPANDGPEQTAIQNILSGQVGRNPGDRVDYAIAKYLPPNQMPPDDDMNVGMLFA